MDDTTNAGTAPVTVAAPTDTSLLAGLLSILKQDTGGAVVPLLESFKSSIDASPSIEGASAAGLKFAADAQLGLPAIAGTLIKDTTDLLVADAVTAITKATQASATVAPTNPPGNGG